MAFTTVKDLLAMQEILSNDETLQSYGYMPERVYIDKISTEELKEDDKYIVIQPAAAFTNGNGINIGIELQYEVIVVSHSKYIGNAYNVCDTIKNLLNDTEIGNNHVLSIVEPTVVVEMEKGMRMLSQSFLCPVTISAIRDPKKPLKDY